MTVDWKGRPYVGRDECDRHGVTWHVRVGWSWVCEFCALGMDQRPRAERRRVEWQ